MVNEYVNEYINEYIKLCWNVQHLNSNKLRDRLVIQKECSRPQKKMQDVGLKIILRNTVQVSSA